MERNPQNGRSYTCKTQRVFTPYNWLVTLQLLYTRMTCKDVLSYNHIPRQIGLFLILVSIIPLPFISTFDRDFLSCIKVRDPIDTPINVTELIFRPIVQTNVVSYKLFDIRVQHKTVHDNICVDNTLGFERPVDIFLKLNKQ